MQCRGSFFISHQRNLEITQTGVVALQSSETKELFFLSIPPFCVWLLSSRLPHGLRWPLYLQPSGPSAREKIKEGRRAKGPMPFWWVSPCWRAFLEVSFSNFHLYPISQPYCKGCWEISFSSWAHRVFLTMLESVVKAEGRMDLGS